MKKNVFHTTAILCTFVLIFSFVTSDWYLFQKDNYKILFPEKPTLDSTVVDSQIGKLTVLTYMVETKEASPDSNLVYGLSVTDYPGQYKMSTEKSFIKGIFDGMIKGAVTNMKGKLISEKEITFKTYPGREIKIDYGDGTAVVTMQMILIGNRVFALQTIALPGKDENNNAVKFFNSFDVQ